MMLKYILLISTFVLGTLGRQVGSPQACGNVMCMMNCPHGFQVDRYGCEICKCRIRRAACSDVQCRMYCENGFQKDENGCDICQCN